MLLHISLLLLLILLLLLRLLLLLMLLLILLLLMLLLRLLLLLLILLLLILLLLILLLLILLLLLLLLLILLLLLLLLLILLLLRLLLLLLVVLRSRRCLSSGVGCHDWSGGDSAGMRMRQHCEGTTQSNWRNVRVSLPLLLLCVLFVRIIFVSNCFLGVVQQSIAVCTGRDSCPKPRILNQHGNEPVESLGVLLNVLIGVHAAFIHGSELDSAGRGYLFNVVYTASEPSNPRTQRSNVVMCNRRFTCGKCWSRGL
jgi:hypothetical protein